MGMEYKPSASYNFATTRKYHSTEYQFQFPKSQLHIFEQIASSQPPPYDPRALTEKNPDPPVRNCVFWAHQVLREFKAYDEANKVIA